MVELPRQLIALAINNGATGADFIPASDLVVEEKLAEFCRQPRCPNYGLSLSCPPSVEGPTQFKKWCLAAEAALAVKIDVPTAVLRSPERLEVMGLLHEIVAVVERQAAVLGYRESRGFAGGSCKQIFCADHRECLALQTEGKCRNPEMARPSMSGFGVNVAEIMKAAGRSGDTLSDSEMKNEAMSWVAGLVLLIRGEKVSNQGKSG